VNKKGMQAIRIIDEEELNVSGKHLKTFIGICEKVMRFM
jgi:hypothetical protein